MSSSTTSAFSTLDWGHVDLARVPHLPVPPPGPLSKQYHDRCTKYFKGLSGQVKLFPVTFDSGEGCVLRDIDGNEYILSEDITSPILFGPWQSGLQQNASFVLQPQDTDLGLQAGASRQFWMAISGVTNDGQVIIFGAGWITIYNPGSVYPLRVTLIFHKFLDNISPMRAEARKPTSVS